MRTPRRAIKQTFPAYIWQENCAHFRQIPTQPWDTPAAPPGKPRGALHTRVPGTQFEEDPRFTKAFTCLNPFVFNGLQVTECLPSLIKVVQVSGCSACDCRQSQGLCHAACARESHHKQRTTSFCQPALPQQYHKIS